MATAEKNLVEIFASLPEAVQRRVLDMAAGAAMALEVQEEAGEDKKSA